MSPFVKEKSFYKTLFAIAMPIAAQNLITFMVGMADTVMLGSLGEVILSASSLANQVFFVLMIVGFGVSSAATVFASQYWGKGDITSIRKIMTIMIRVITVISLLFTFAAILIPERVMTLFTSDTAVIAAGASYLRIVAWGYLFYSISNVMLNLLRAVHTVNISVVVYLSSLVVNVFFNWVLIFGKFGAPVMGIRGAALATVFARITEFLIVLCFFAFFEKKIVYRIKDLFGSVKGYVGAFVKTGAPVVLNEMLWSVGVSMIAIIIGHVGTNFVAANSIANIVWQFVSVFIMGLGNATSVVIGNAIGSGEHPKYVRQKALTISMLAACFGILSAVMMILIRPLAVNFYDVSQATKDLAFDLILSYAVVIVVQSVAMQQVVGILRGGGDTKFAMLVDVLFLWVVSIPLGAYVGLVLHWAPPLVYVVLKSDEFFKVIFCSWRILCTKWVRDVTIPSSNPDVPNHLLTENDENT